VTTLHTHASVQRGKHGKAERQRALVEAATAVFAEHGYDAATTREIAERAGCSEGLIHRYFQGKRGLLLWILENKAAEVAGRLEAAIPDRDTVEEEVEQLLMYPLETMWEDRDFMRVTVSRCVIDPEIGHVIGHHLNNARVQLIAEKLRRHQRAGRIRADADLDAIAHGIAGMNLTCGFFGQVVFAMDRAEIRRIGHGIAPIITRGLKPDSAACTTTEA
jgi:AcrR family transcriptional regulator